MHSAIDAAIRLRTGSTRLPDLVFTISDEIRERSSCGASVTSRTRPAAPDGSYTVAPNSSLRARVVIPLENNQVAREAEDETLRGTGRCGHAGSGIRELGPEPSRVRHRIIITRVRLIFDIFGQTLRTLWAHKLRSFLTMFGIAWGVGSLLLLVGLGEGFRAGNRKQFDSLGENVMFIWSGRAPAMQGSFTALRQYYLDLSRLRGHSHGVSQRGGGRARHPAQRHPRGQRLLPGQRPDHGSSCHVQPDPLPADE